MHHFAYKDGVLHAEDVSVADIAAAVGTPFYIYSTATLTRHLKVFGDAFGALKPVVCYAMKANSNQAVLATLAKAGSGADVVSEGELRRALAAGIPASKIMFSGVGKTAAEMRFALDAGILCFNVESEPELERLNDVALAMGKVAPVSLRINPDVDAKTHAKISTGKAENKFGIDWQRARAVYARAGALPGIKPTGIDMHIGSQITDLAPFDDAFARLSDLIADLRSDGHSIDHVDLGGGLGIPYRHDNNPPPLPHACAEAAELAVAGLAKPHMLQDIVGPCLGMGPRQASQLSGHAHKVDGGFIARDSVPVGHITDLGSGALFGGCGLASQDLDGARVRRLEPQHEPHQRGLARAVGSQ